MAPAVRLFRRFAWGQDTVERGSVSVRNKAIFVGKQQRVRLTEALSPPLRCAEVVQFQLPREECWFTFESVGQADAFQRRCEAAIGRARPPRSEEDSASKGLPPQEAPVALAAETEATKGLRAAGVRSAGGDTAGEQQERGSSSMSPPPSGRDTVRYQSDGTAREEKRRRCDESGSQMPLPERRLEAARSESGASPSTPPPRAAAGVGGCLPPASSTPVPPPKAEPPPNGGLDPTVCPRGVAGEAAAGKQLLAGCWSKLEVLGKGHFSEVWLALSAETGERQAVKAIDKRIFGQFRSKRMSALSIESEAQILASLEHPHIVRLVKTLDTDSHLYLGLEYVSGGDLLKSLQDGPLQEIHACRLFRELADALVYLQDRSIVHRDLKPENVLLTSRDPSIAHAKLGDFGLSRLVLRSRDCRTYCGTLQYMAPEVIDTIVAAMLGERAAGQLGIAGRSAAAASKGYGPKADMWSLGVILYVMLCGVPPFEEDSELLLHISSGSYEFDVPSWQSVSMGAKMMVRCLMTVKPEDRFTAREALAHTWLLQLDKVPEHSSAEPE